MSRMRFGFGPVSASTREDRRQARSAADGFAEVRRLVIALSAGVILLSLGSPVLGAPTISCHCFQDRSFDPAQPRRVEPYLLATTRNSFLAVAYGQSKKEIVRLRMSGTAGEDLWIAYYLASKVDIPVSELLQARKKGDSWRSVQAALPQIDPARTGPLFGRTLTQRGTDEELAQAAADDTLILGAGISPEDLRQLRTNGADTGEIILAQLVSRRIDRPMTDLHAEVQAGRLTWGGLVDSVGINPGEMESAVHTLFRKANK